MKEFFIWTSLTVQRHNLSAFHPLKCSIIYPLCSDKPPYIASIKETAVAPINALMRTNKHIHTTLNVCDTTQSSLK